MKTGVLVSKYSFSEYGYWKYMMDTIILWMWWSKIHYRCNHSPNLVIENTWWTQPFYKRGPQKIHDRCNHSPNLVTENTWRTQPFYEHGPQKYRTDAAILWIWSSKMQDRRNHFLNLVLKNTWVTSIFWIGLSKMHNRHNRFWNWSFSCR